MEHPAYVDSWKPEELVELANLDGVMTQIADQCMYGLTTPGLEGLSAKKPTKFLSNSWCILPELFVRCDKQHVHQQLMGGRGAKAAEYPDALCKAICRGLANQKRYDASGKVCTGPVTANVLQSLMTMIQPGVSEFPEHWRDSKHEPDGTDS